MCVSVSRSWVQPRPGGCSQEPVPLTPSQWLLWVLLQATDPVARQTEHSSPSFSTLKDSGGEVAGSQVPPAPSHLYWTLQKPQRLDSRHAVCIKDIY